MRRRLKISPRKLPPLSPERVERHTDTDYPAFADVLPKDVRCLVYKQLAVSTLLVLEKHELFEEITACVEEIVLDMPTDVEFLAKFTRLKKISGEAKEDEKTGLKYQDFGRITEKPTVQAEAAWEQLMARNVQFDHILFSFPVQNMRNYQQKLRQYLLTHPPFNFMTNAVMVAGDLFLNGLAIFDGGMYCPRAELKEFTAADVVRINASGVNKFWVDPTTLIELSTEHEEDDGADFEDNIKDYEWFLDEVKANGFKIDTLAVAPIFVVKLGNKFKPRIILWNLGDFPPEFASLTTLRENVRQLLVQVKKVKGKKV